MSQRAVENRKMEKTGCKIICGAPMTLAVKGLMMMMMTTSNQGNRFLCDGPHVSFPVSAGLTVH